MNQPEVNPNPTMYSSIQQRPKKKGKKGKGKGTSIVDEAGSEDMSKEQVSGWLGRGPLLGRVGGFAAPRWS